MKFFVTGGAGYVGSVLVGRLLEDTSTDQVTVYDSLMYRQTSLLDRFRDRRFRFVHGDARDQNRMLDAAQGADVIIPLAAIVGMPACENDKPLAADVNLHHVKTLLDNCKGATVLFPNTNSGYGVGQGEVLCTEETPISPISWYGKTKCEAEKMVLDAGGVSLRLATVFGLSPRQRLDLLVNDFTYRACRDGFIVLFEQHFKRNYIHVRDVAEAFVTVLEKKVSGAFNVGLSEANLSKRELCEAIKRHVPKFVITADDFAKDVDKRNYVVSNAKLEALGWRPRHSLDDGIAELVQAYPMLRRVETAAFTNL